MELAINYFGSIGRHLKNCLEDATDLGFRGLAEVSGDGLPESLFKQIGSMQGVALSAASWGSLLDMEMRDSQFNCASLDQDQRFHAQSQMKQVLSRIKLTGASLLLVEAGVLSFSGARERGDRLLADLRETGQIKAGLEALEPFQLARNSVGERQLEELARFLHLIRSYAPGLQIALLPSASPAGLLTPTFLKMLRQEAGLPWLGYWHDCGRCESRAAFGLDQPGDWLDLGASFMSGCTLQDWAEGQDLLLPGLGQVDFELLADYMPRSTLQVLSVAPLNPLDTLPQAREALASAGLH